MLRTSIAIAILITLVGLAVYGGKVIGQDQTSDKQTQEIEIPPELEGTLRGDALKAKSEGRTSIRRVMESFGPSIGSYDDVVSKCSVIVAEPILKRSYLIDPITIGTWYKVKLREVLSKKDPPPYDEFDNLELPADMLPVADDELLIYRFGGTQSVEGVTITMIYMDFPEFSIGQKYLLFADLNMNRRVGVVPDVMAAFLIGSDGTLGAMMHHEPGEHPIADKIQEKFKSNIANLRKALQSESTSNCDTDRRQACLEGEGTWDENKCKCTTRRCHNCV